MVSLVQSAFFNFLVPAAAQVAKNYEKVECVYNSIQAWCTRRANGSPRFFTWIEAKKMPLFFADIGSLLWTGALAVRHIWPSLSIVDVPFLYFRLIPTSVLALVGVSCGIELLCNKIVKKISQKTLDSFEGANGESIEFGRSSHEENKRVLYGVRAIVNTVLFCFFPYNPFFIVNATLEAYSFVTLLQRRWLVFNKDIAVECFEGGRRVADRVKISFLFLMRNVPGPILPDQKTCMICQEDTIEPANASYFCDNHFFHKRCMLMLLQHKVNRFLEALEVEGREVIETRNGSSRLSANYRISVPETEKFSCPYCRIAPGCSELVVKFHDVLFNDWAPSTIRLRG